MQNESRRRIETLFDAARTRAAGSERQAYLDGACGDDADLRSRVEALLLENRLAVHDALHKALATGKDVRYLCIVNADPFALALLRANQHASSVTMRMGV